MSAVHQQIGEWVGVAPAQTEQELLQIIERRLPALSQAESVYDSRERALAWLRRPHPQLGQRPPAELLKTDAGSRIVEELPIQIDEGFFA